MDDTDSTVCWIRPREGSYEPLRSDRTAARPVGEPSVILKQVLT